MKRILRTMLLALAIVLTLPVTAWAGEHGFFDDAQWAEVVLFLDYISNSQELFGFEDVDFDDLEVTDAIATYEYHNGAFQRGVDVWLVYEDGSPAFAFWGPFDGQYLIAHLYYDALIIGLEEFGGAPLAVVSDSSGMGVTDGHDYVHALDLSEETVALLDSFHNTSRNASIWAGFELTEVDEHVAVDYRKTVVNRGHGTSLGFYYCTVEPPEQHLYYSCWAACSVSLLKYRGYYPMLGAGESYNDIWLVNQVYNYYGDASYSLNYDGDFIAGVLNYYLGRSTPADHAYDVYLGCPTYNAFYAYVNADSPVIGLTWLYNEQQGSYYPNNPGHAILINGYQIGGSLLCAYIPYHLNTIDYYYKSALAYNATGHYYYLPVEGTGYNQYRVAGTVYETY